MGEEDRAKDSILYLSECKSFIDCDKKIQQSLLSTILSARKAALLRMATIYTSDSYAEADIPSILSAVNAELVPLFQQVPAQLNQIVTNAIMNVLGDPAKFIDKILMYLDDHPEYAGIFGCMILPGICFYYLTTEFVAVGATVLEEAITRFRGRPTMLMLASFFDAFPIFNENLWGEFDALRKDHSILYSFEVALPRAFVSLTPTHADLTAKVFQIDRIYALDFFFDLYFASHAKYRYKDNPAVLTELTALFAFVTSNPDSPITTKLVNSLGTKQTLHPRPLSYAVDLHFPIVFVVLSCAEMDILYEIFHACNAIKTATKYDSLKIPPERLHSLLPGYVQYSPRKFINEQKIAHLPLIFPKEESHTEPSSEEFGRAWEQLNNIAKESALSPIDLLDHPPTPLIASTLAGLPVVHSPEFRKFVMAKVRSQIIQIQATFEKFNLWISTEHEILNHKSIFDLDAEFFLGAFMKKIMESLIIKDFYVRKDNIDQVVNPDSVYILSHFWRNVADDVNPPATTISVRIPNLVSPSLSDLLRNHRPQFTSPEILLEYLRHVMNIWPIDVGVFARLRKAFAPFAESWREKLYGTERMEEITGNKFFMRSISDIKELEGKPLGDKFLSLNQILDALYQFGCQSDKNLRKRIKSKRQYVAELAFDCMLLSGLSDSCLIFVWYSHVSMFYPEYVKALGPKLMKLWPIIIAALVNSSRKSDRAVFALFAEAFDKIPDYSPRVDPAVPASQ